MNNRLLDGLLLLVYYFYTRSLRIKVVENNPDRQKAYVFWHNSIFPLIYTHQKRSIVPLISMSRDGQIVVKTLKKFGFGFVSGSSTHGGRRAGIKLIKEFRAGKTIALTPDGPVGPREVFKESAFKLLKTVTQAISFVGVQCKPCLILHSWDGFKLPLPFSRCVIYVREKIVESPESAQIQLKLANEIAARILNEQYFGKRDV